MTHNHSDTAWKEILDAHFKDFLDLCLPKLSKRIDWTLRWKSLDQELQAIAVTTGEGKKLLDKLFSVHLKNGGEHWILLHIEIQASLDQSFSERMFMYGYRIYDRYRKPVVSCAILTDSHKQWRPQSHKIGLAGS